MDETTREALQAVFEQDDQARADFDSFQARRSRSKSQQRSGDFGLLYRDQHDALIEPAPRAQATMSPEQQRPWDEWFDARLKKNFDDFYKDVIAWYVSEYLHGKLKTLREELVAEIGVLRADVTLDRSVRRQEVIDLPTFVKKRNRHAA